jgi:hypothetical protein
VKFSGDKIEHGIKRPGSLGDLTIRDLMECSDVKTHLDHSSPFLMPNPLHDTVLAEMACLTGAVKHGSASRQ